MRRSTGSTQLRSWYRFFILSLYLTGCGYALKDSKSILVEQEGIHRVFIAPIVNNSYKPGIESVIYNELTRIITEQGSIQSVGRMSEADAVLEGTVQASSYQGSASAQVVNLNPAGLGSGLPTAPYIISTEYTANLNCSFHLKRTHPLPDKKEEIWASSFSRSKPFPAANQLDVPGMTAPLINESEFDRALFDLAKSMMADLNESMLAMF